MISRKIQQNCLVQIFCATYQGQSYPLLQSEAILFPCHLYACTKTYRCSVLGSQPLFLLFENTYTCIFAYTLTQPHINMTNPSNTTIKYLVFVYLYFELLYNIVLSLCHSCDIFNCHITVDNKSG